jgi:hypothetical protein
VYSAVHVKRDGKWMLDRMSEEPVRVVPSNYERLKDLEWMIGTWVDQDETARVETTCSWTKNHNFITRSFTISIGDQIEMSGMQLIGWDPATQRIRSWVFDSDGGFGDATWSKKENRWIINAAATLPDGRKSSAMNIMTVVANPNPKSFSHAILERFDAGLKDAGHTNELDSVRPGEIGDGVIAKPRVEHEPPTWPARTGALREARDCPPAFRTGTGKRPPSSPDCASLA